MYCIINSFKLLVKHVNSLFFFFFKEESILLELILTSLTGVSVSVGAPSPEGHLSAAGVWREA